MKTTIKLAIAALLCCVVLPSCLKEQEDLFDDNPTVRMTEYLTNVQKTLMAPSNGWVMYYYPDEYQRYGGYNYTVKFTADKVEAGFEFADDLDDTVTSLYRLGTDTGPTLSFDTNNDFLHFFSTPSSQAYQAFGGDFEFMLLEVEEDYVKMMGRRSGNTIIMRPLKEAGSEYLKKVANTVESIIVTGMKGSVGGVAVEAEFDFDYQQASLSFGENTETIAFRFTDEGISLYQPVEIGNASVQDFVFNAEALTFTPKGYSDVLVGTVPEGWRDYDAYEGDYIFIYDYEDEETYSSIPVKLIPEEDGTSYLMTGLNPNYHFVWKYSRATGTLSFQYQDLGTMSNGYIVRLCGIDDASGYFTWTPNVDFGVTEWNGDEENPEYMINPGYISGGRIYNGIIVYCWAADGETSIGVPAANTGWKLPGNYNWIVPYALVKQ